MKSRVWVFLNLVILVQGTGIPDQNKRSSIIRRRGFLTHLRKNPLVELEKVTSLD